MKKQVPHLVQYQGSKRKLAPQILQFMPKQFGRLIEPFSGMAAISIAVATEDRTSSFLINDLNKPLVDLLQEATENPKELITEYRELWNQQFVYGENHPQHFYYVREQFNNGEKTPVNLLYLIARCVKGAVRYGKNGNFNQSPDKRRHGLKPNTLEKNVYAISELLKGKTTFSALDYHAIFKSAKPGDLLYLDPPYQGVTNGRDSRYYAGVPFDEFVEAISELNKKQVDFIISYDGLCGIKEYGQSLPETLGCKKLESCKFSYARQFSFS